VNPLNVGEVTQYWSGEILHGAGTVTLRRIREMEMPLKLRQNLLQHSESILWDEIKRICDGPYLRSSTGEADADILKTGLSELLSEWITLPDGDVRQVVERSFDSMFDEWGVEPVSFRQAAEDPAGLAAEVFRRTAVVATAPAGEGELGLELLARVCDASGLDPLAQALRAEEQLGTTVVDEDGFVLITRRLLKLKEHYRIGRRMVSYEGMERGLARIRPAAEAAAAEEVIEEAAPPVAPTEAAPRPPMEGIITLKEEIAPPPAPEPVTAAPVAAEPPTPPEPEITPPTAVEEPITMEAEVATPPEPETAPAEAVAPAPPPTQARPVTKPELPSLPADLAPPATLDDSGLSLYSILMSDENRGFYSGTIMDKDLKAYQRLVIQICRQKVGKNALIIADNELFIREISPAAGPAAKFLTTIRRYFIE